MSSCPTYSAQYNYKSKYKNVQINNNLTEVDKAKCDNCKISRNPLFGYRKTSNFCSSCGSVSKNSRNVLVTKEIKNIDCNFYKPEFINKARLVNKFNEHEQNFMYHSKQYLEQTYKSFNKNTTKFVSYLLRDVSKVEIKIYPDMPFNQMFVYPDISNCHKYKKLFSIIKQRNPQYNSNCAVQSRSRVQRLKRNTLAITTNKYPIYNNIKKRELICSKKIKRYLKYLVCGLPDFDVIRQTLIEKSHYFVRAVNFIIFGKPQFKYDNYFFGIPHMSEIIIPLTLDGVNKLYDLKQSRYLKIDLINKYSDSTTELYPRLILDELSNNTISNVKLEPDPNIDPSATAYTCLLYTSPSPRD